MPDNHMKRCLTVLYSALFLILHIKAELPQELDPFLEVLFGTDQCEPFLSDGKYLSVSTVECKPYTCDFPYQLCMRAAESYKDEKANECREVPIQCLTAANGGSAPPHLSSKTTPAAVVGPSPGNGPNVSPVISAKPNSGATGPTQITSPNTGQVPSNGNIGNKQRVPICEQGVPDGRFCGFALKFAYNMETGNCDQFWFPGCRTENTNDNLFNSLAECREATGHCEVHRPAPQVTQPPLPPDTTWRPDAVVPNAYTRQPNAFVPNGPAPGTAGGQPNSYGNFGGQFSQISQLFTGGGLGGGAGPPQPAAGSGAEYGGGALGNAGGGAGVTQPPNFIRLIANTLREVGEKKTGDGSKPPLAMAGEWSNQFTNILQSL
ncbi:kunitz/Bovine pancreatic trypsin inhibitor domain-containing protein [Ditylenchus destructor]|uniref:Kunitz/Bovine pancreatic trypsin inhibitor domain-containing protein n=1 Tax=Ditylenchus destructor TaxID=166010 RepID=A0AAD4NBD4_9BILA|nr:kunitz/Bovine pancreatic trypsin inhibitor domain-containing protein [Ditylenchus destructor]